MDSIRHEGNTAGISRGPRPHFLCSSLLGIASFFLLACAQIAATYIRALGFDPRNAAHNFEFNFRFFFPAILLSSALAGASIFFYIRSLITTNRVGARLTASQALALLPSLPVLGQDMILLAQIVGLILYTKGS